MATSKHSVVIAGHKTSLSLENAFFKAFKEIAEKKNVTLGALAEEVSHRTDGHNLSSAIRVFILEHYQAANEAQLTGQSTPDGQPQTTGNNGSAGN